MRRRSYIPHRSTADRTKPRHTPASDRARSPSASAAACAPLECATTHTPLSDCSSASASECKTADAALVLFAALAPLHTLVFAVAHGTAAPSPSSDVQVADVHSALRWLQSFAPENDFIVPATQSVSELAAAALQFAPAEALQACAPAVVNLVQWLLQPQLQDRALLYDLLSVAVFL